MRWLDTLIEDTRYALRSLARDRGVTAMVALALALGVGVNAAAFAVLDRIYLRPPSGLEDPSSLRRVWVKHFNSGDGVPFASTSINFDGYRLLAATAPDSTRLAVYHTDGALRQGTALGAPKLSGVYASAGYWRVLGIRPALGRTFTADEDRMGAGADVAVVSDDFWREQLGGDRSALGRTIAVESKRYTVIGVLPPDFTGLEQRLPDVWMPLASMPSPPWMTDGEWWQTRYFTGLHAVYRAAEGDALATWEQRATVAWRRMEKEWFPKRPDSQNLVLLGGIIEAHGPATPGQEMLIATRLGAVALVVLVIACANVVNLLLARAVRRRREIAVRLAMGISRRRLLRLLGTESLVLAALASAGALLAGWWAGEALRAMLMEGAEWREHALDWRVALFTVALSLVAALASGLVPALQVSRPDLTEALRQGVREGGQRHGALRAGLVVMQAALSVALLVGAALFVRSLQNVRGLDIGFDARQLYFGGLEFEQGRAPADPVLGAALASVTERLRAHPAVEEVALTTFEPMRGISFTTLFVGTAPEPEGLKATMTAVSPSYFRATGMRLLEGRTLGERGAREVVVNRAMADKLWPGERAIGRCLRFKTVEEACHTVVGVAETARRTSVIEAEPAVQYYLGLGDPVLKWEPGTIIVRTGEGEHTGEAAAAALRTALKTAFPSALPKVTAMTENLEPEYRPWQLGARLFTGMGLLALVVAMVGMYGTVSYGVSQRTHELGVRSALGARAADLVGLVLGQAMRTAVLGVALGVALAIAAGRLVSALVYGVSPRDPVVLVTVSLALLAVATLAALLPALRGSRVDPATVLRSE